MNWKRLGKRLGIFACGIFLLMCALFIVVYARWVIVDRQDEQRLIMNRSGREMLVDLGDGLWMEFLPVSTGELVIVSRSKEEITLRDIVNREAFWLGKYEVTQAQFKRVMGWNPSDAYWFRHLPVECVSWHNAMLFCKRLTEQERLGGRLPEGVVYTLPSDVQWEYACRAGTIADYAGELDAIGWHHDNSDGRAHPVGMKKPNEWGFHDMHGNVWEWCRDTYEPSSVVLDIDPGLTFRSNRGGSWFSDPEYCESACRFGFIPTIEHCDVGFRVCLSGDDV